MVWNTVIAGIRGDSTDPIKNVEIVNAKSSGLSETIEKIESRSD